MLQHMSLSGLMDQPSSSSSSKAGPAQRLLVLSAGLDNAPGAPIGRAVMAAAAEFGIDLTEDNPCARLGARTSISSAASKTLVYFPCLIRNLGNPPTKLKQVRCHGPGLVRLDHLHGQGRSRQSSRARQGLYPKSLAACSLQERGHTQDGSTAPIFPAAFLLMGQSAYSLHSLVATCRIDHTPAFTCFVTENLCLCHCHAGVFTWGTVCEVRLESQPLYKIGIFTAPLQGSQCVRHD
jgi:hypothetical protein